MNDIILARKRKFQALKEKAGGASALTKSMDGEPWRVYFTDDGRIACFTNNPEAEIDPVWHTYDFSQEQLGILKGKDVNLYRVHKHPLIDNKYSIEAAKEEARLVALATDFLEQIEFGEAQADLYCEISRDCFKVWLDESVREEYTDVDPAEALRDGKRNLRFYLTSPNDPHMLFAKADVCLRDLLMQESVEKVLDSDYRKCSIYSKSIFDKCTRRGSNGQD